MPAASRAASGSSAGSPVTGVGSGSSSATPARPAAITQPTSRYGFAVASKHLSSAFADSSVPLIMRSAVSRVSWPQHCHTPAQRDGCSRRKLAGCPAPIATSAGSSASTPARNAAPAGRRAPACCRPRRARTGAGGRPTRRRPGRRSARTWRAGRARGCATRTVWRSSTASSAAPTGSFGATDSSSCAAAYSGWNCWTVETLRGQVGHQLGGVPGDLLQPDLPVRRPVERGHEALAGRPEDPLVLERHPQREALARARPPPAGGERPLARDERLAVLGELVRRRPRPARHRRERHRPRQVGHAAAGRRPGRRGTPPPP